MKCIKHDLKWFENKLKQYLTMNTSPRKRQQRLEALKRLSKEKGIYKDEN